MAYLEGFETEGYLGKGGYRVVFEAKSKCDKVKYAVKRISLTHRLYRRETLAGALREAVTLATLNHPNIVRYYTSWLETHPAGFYLDHDSKWMDFYNLSSSSSTSSEFEESSSTSSEFEESNLIGIIPQDVKVEETYLFIQMELCERQTLEDWLNDEEIRQKEGSNLEALYIFQQVVQAIDYIHNQCIVHRDIQPRNIFFSGKGRVKLGDFGLGDFGFFIPRYMSPGQLAGSEYVFEDDIYSLGIILFELLIPFSSALERHSTIKKLQQMEFPSNFSENYPREVLLLKQMLDHDYVNRPMASTIADRIKQSMEKIKVMCYPVNLKKKRGRVLMININSFDNNLFNARVGSETDVFNLHKLFLQLDFIVTIKQDLNAEQLIMEIETFAQREDHKEYSCCFVFLMSHGANLGNGNWGIVAKDGRKIDTEDVIEKFSNQRAKNLIGKPKIIVINSCRGDTSDYGVAHPVAEGVYRKPQLHKDGRNESADILHRSIDDMLIVKSTVPRFASHRDVNSGSWLVMELCHVFAQHACKEDVDTLFRLTDEKLKSKKGPRNERQTLEISSRGMNKKLFLYPGLKHHPN